MEHDFCPICDLDLRPPWEREDWDASKVGTAGDTLELRHFDNERWHGVHETHRHLMDSPDVMKLRGDFLSSFRPLSEKLGLE